MIVKFVMWDLEGSPSSIEQLRSYLRDESVEAFSKVAGLRFKAWLSGQASNWWGAIYLWESREEAEQPLPSRARELIGKDPDIVEWFELEASVEGVFQLEQLARRGLAFEG